MNKGLLILLFCMSLKAALSSTFRNTSDIFIPSVKDSVGLEIGVSPVVHMEGTIFGGSFGNRLIEIYSASKPFDLYQLNSGNFRFGILAPPISGGALMVMFMTGFTSVEGLEFIRKYGAVLFIPSYLLNPEIRVIPFEQFKLYAGYSFDLVHEERVRPIACVKAGGLVGIKKGVPKIRIGIERIFYRGFQVDNYGAAISFGM